VNFNDPVPWEAQMSESRVVVYIGSESELCQVLREAAAKGEAVVVDTDDAQYEIDVVVRWDAEQATTPDQPDSILSIIGIGSSGEPSDIDRFKDEYIADAIDPRPR
jgi:hypothetical protein